MGPDRHDQRWEAVRRQLVELGASDQFIHHAEARFRVAADSQDPGRLAEIEREIVARATIPGKATAQTRTIEHPKQAPPTQPPPIKSDRNEIPGWGWALFAFIGIYWLASALRPRALDALNYAIEELLGLVFGIVMGPGMLLFCVYAIISAIRGGLTDNDRKDIVLILVTGVPLSGWLTYIFFFK